MLVAIARLPTKRVGSSGQPAPDGDIATTESTRILPQMQDSQGLEPGGGRAFQSPRGPPERAGYTSQQQCGGLTARVRAAGNLKFAEHVLKGTGCRSG